MPARSRVSVSDLPVDVMISLVRNPDNYEPMLRGWTKAKGEALHAEEDARERLNQAGDAENLVHQREVAATEMEAQLNKREADLDTRDARLVAAEQNVGERGRALDGRQTALDEREATINQASATLRAAAEAVVNA